MKRISPFYRGVLAVLALVILMGAGRRYVYVQKVYQNEGDTAAGVSVTCDDSGWTTLLASSSTRRSAVCQSLTGNTISVCVSTATAGTCVDGTVGIELSPGSAFSDFSEDQLNCQARSGGSEQVKCLYYLDSSD